MSDPSPKNPPSFSHRLESIDFLRGVAALAVVITHSISFGGKNMPSDGWFQALVTLGKHGWMGVPLFFVISGFCIHAPFARQMAREGHASIDFVKFWKRRARRLYPPYFAMLCIGMATMVLAYLKGQAEIYPDPKPVWMVYDFVLHAFMLHGFHPLLDQAGGNPPMWTLAREEYLYLMYFALLAWRRTRGVVAAVVIAQLLGWFFVIAMQFVLPPQSTLPADENNWWQLTWRLVHSSALVLWIQWALGMLAVEHYFGLIALPRWCRSPIMALFWLVMGLACIAWFPYAQPLTLGMAFFTLLNWCVDTEKSGVWPENKAITWFAGVGVFSYSLYLTHNVVIRAFEFVALRRVQGFINNPFTYLLIEAALVIGCLLAGKLFFFAVERHFLNAKSDKKQEPKTGEHNRQPFSSQKDSMATVLPETTASIPQHTPESSA